MSKIGRIRFKWLTPILAIALLAVFSVARDLHSQDDYSVGGFIDEDGDGFNDLLPDSDGDGVPDGLDPDSGPAAPDSGYMHRYMHSFEEQHQMMWENMNGEMPGGHMEHGEPGMYGPGDSTMHGGHMGGGHHGGGMGGGMDDGGGMGPGGGMGGGGSDPGGGMGHGGMGPDSEGGTNRGTEIDLSNTPKQRAIPATGETPSPGQNERSQEKSNQGQDKTP